MNSERYKYIVIVAICTAVLAINSYEITAIPAIVMGCLLAFMSFNEISLKNQERKEQNKKVAVFKKSNTNKK